jgi:hypothetical protein
LGITPPEQQLAAALAAREAMVALALKLERLEDSGS